MTGWTQFTARFEEEKDADAIVEDADAAYEGGNLSISYHESLGKIARVRLVGYNQERDVIRMLKEAGPIEAVMVANFNDTTDSGEAKLYRPQRRAGWKAVGSASCPEATRWDFRYESCGLVETGTRAGNDFSLEEQYGESAKEVVPLDKMEEIANSTLEMLKTEAKVEAEEFRR